MNRVNHNYGHVNFNKHYSLEIYSRIAVAISESNTSGILILIALESNRCLIMLNNHKYCRIKVHKLSLAHFADHQLQCIAQLFITNLLRARKKKK
jgi:hypothetical protein